MKTNTQQPLKILYGRWVKSATQEVYDSLISMGYQDSLNGFEKHLFWKATVFFIDDNNEINSYSGHHTPTRGKEVFFHKGNFYDQPFEKPNIIYVVVGQTPISNFVMAVFYSRYDAEKFIKKIGDDNSPYIEEHKIEEMANHLPMPIMDEKGLDDYDTYYVVEPALKEGYVDNQGRWEGGNSEIEMLNNGVIHTSKENAAIWGKYIQNIILQTINQETGRALDDDSDSPTLVITDKFPNFEDIELDEDGNLLVSGPMFFKEIINELDSLNDSEQIPVQSQYKILKLAHENGISMKWELKDRTKLWHKAMDWCLKMVYQRQIMKFGNKLWKL